MSFVFLLARPRISCFSNTSPARLKEYEILNMACARSDLLRVSELLINARNRPNVQRIRGSALLKHHALVTRCSLWFFVLSQAAYELPSVPQRCQVSSVCVQVWVCVFAQRLRPAFDKHLWEESRLSSAVQSDIITQPFFISRSPSVLLTQRSEVTACEQLNVTLKLNACCCRSVRGMMLVWVGLTHDAFI